MNAFSIFLKVALGIFAISVFTNTAKLIKAKERKGVIVSYALLGVTILVQFTIDVACQFLSSETHENLLAIIRRADTILTGYFCGIATVLLLCMKFKKKTKIPNQSREPTSDNAGDPVNTQSEAAPL
jgi:hypothetical protein